MATLTREQIVAARLKHEKITVPEWGGDLCVWELSAAKELEFEEAAEKLKRGETIMKLVGLCAGDEQGPFNPPLSDDELRKLSSTALLRIFAVAQRVNAMTKDAAEKLLKNS